MKRTAHSLIGCVVRAQDGDIGTIEEFYFDDHTWIIRYMIVDTGEWHPVRRVLISTAALIAPEWMSRIMPVDLTREQVRNSPGIDTAKPVSRQHETELHAYYGWPTYWSMSTYGGGFGVLPPLPPFAIQADNEEMKVPPEVEGNPKGDPNLRSTAAVTGYHIQAPDGEIGHVEDFIIDNDNWAIRFIVVNTRNWLPGKKVLVYPRWIGRVSWEESKVFVDISRESIKSSLVYDPSKPISLDYEDKLFTHYARKK